MSDSMTRVQEFVTYEEPWRKHWLIKKTSEELSVYNLNIATNNGAESYHSKLKARIKTRHPRIWTFMSYINEIILDVDNDIGRIRSGREISRARKQQVLEIKNIERSLNRNFVLESLPHGSFCNLSVILLAVCLLYSILN